MTMKGEPVPAEGLDHIKALDKWLEQYPNDVMVRSKLAEIQRDPRFAEPTSPTTSCPQVLELAEFPVPPGLKNGSPAVWPECPAGGGTSGSPSCAWMNI